MINSQFNPADFNFIWNDSFPAWIKINKQGSGFIITTELENHSGDTLYTITKATTAEVIKIFEGKIKTNTQAEELFETLGII